ncbi:MAG: FtsQ-type POTRA domain-containing protein [Deltaproteobacteria bacterium]|nr:FtsQ-type POTRA domain-containing protein [Deltaproteobacteria bacterium]
MRDYHTKRIRNSRRLLLRKVRKQKTGQNKRRETLWRWGVQGGKVLSALLVLSVFAAGVHALLTSPYFEVKEITIVGDHHLPEEVARRYERRLKTNIFRLPLRQVQQDLEREPYVKEAFLRRELPDHVYLKIWERRPFARLRTAEGDRLVDREGRVLERIRGKRSSPLPLLHVREKGKPSTEELRAALCLVETMENFGYPPPSEIGEIELSSRRGLILHPSTGGFEICCGSEDFLQKLVRLKRVVEDLADRKWKVKSIDLRFRNQVVVRTARPVRVVRKVAS